MTNAAPTAAPAPASATNGDVFIHAPRAPQYPAEERYAYQRRYGNSNQAATNGVKAKYSCTTVSVYRARFDDTAELRIDTGDERCNTIASAAALLDADALREVARCLIDAAADLDAEADARAIASTTTKGAAA